MSFLRYMVDRLGSASSVLVTESSYSPPQQRVREVLTTIAALLSQNYALRAQLQHENLSAEQIQIRVNVALQRMSANIRSEQNLAHSSALLSIQNDQEIRNAFAETIPVHRAIQTYLSVVSNLDLPEVEYQRAKLNLLQTLARESGGFAREVVDLSAADLYDRFFQWTLGVEGLLQGDANAWQRSVRNSTLNESYLDVAHQLARNLPRNNSEVRHLLEEEIPILAGERELSEILRTNSLIFSRNAWELSTPLIGAVAAIGGGWLGLLGKNRLLAAIIGGAANGLIQTALQIGRQKLEHGQVEGPSILSQIEQSGLTGAACGIVGHALGVLFFKGHDVSWLGSLGAQGLREFRWGGLRFLERQVRFWLDVGTELGCDEVFENRNIQNRMGLDRAAPIQIHPLFKWINNAAGELCGDVYGGLGHHLVQRAGINFDYTIQLQRIEQEFHSLYFQLGEMTVEARHNLGNFLLSYTGQGGSREELIQVIERLGDVREQLLKIQENLCHPDADQDLHGLLTQSTSVKIPHQVRDDKSLQPLSLQILFQAIGNQTTLHKIGQSLQLNADLFFSRAAFQKVTPEMRQVVQRYFASIYLVSDRNKVLKQLQYLGRRIESLSRNPIHTVALLREVLFSSAAASNLKVSVEMNRLEQDWKVRSEIVDQIISAKSDPELKQNFVYFLLNQKQASEETAKNVWLALEINYAQHFPVSNSSSIYRKASPEGRPSFIQFSNFIITQSSREVSLLALLQALNEGKKKIEFKNGKLFFKKSVSEKWEPNLLAQGQKKNEREYRPGERVANISNNFFEDELNPLQGDLTGTSRLAEYHANRGGYGSLAQINSNLPPAASSEILEAKKIRALEIAVPLLYSLHEGAASATLKIENIDFDFEYMGDGCFGMSAVTEAFMKRELERSDLPPNQKTIYEALLQFKVLKIHKEPLGHLKNISFKEVFALFRTHILNEENLEIHSETLQLLHELLFRFDVGLKLNEVSHDELLISHDVFEQFKNELPSKYEKIYYPILSRIYFHLYEKVVVRDEDFGNPRNLQEKLLEEAHDDFQKSYPHQISHNAFHVNIATRNISLYLGAKVELKIPQDLVLRQIIDLGKERHPASFNFLKSWAKGEKFGRSNLKARAAALLALAYYGTPQAVDILIAFCNSQECGDNNFLYFYSIMALGISRDKRVLPELLEAIDESHDSIERSIAALALGRLRTVKAAKALDFEIDFEKDDNFEIEYFLKIYRDYARTNFAEPLVLEDYNLERFSAFEDQPWLIFQVVGLSQFNNPNLIRLIPQAAAKYNCETPEKFFLFLFKHCADLHRDKIVFAAERFHFDSPEILQQIALARLSAEEEKNTNILLDEIYPLSPSMKEAIERDLISSEDRDFSPPFALVQELFQSREKEQDPVDFSALILPTAPANDNYIALRSTRHHSPYNRLEDFRTLYIQTFEEWSSSLARKAAKKLERYYLQVSFRKDGTVTACEAVANREELHAGYGFLEIEVLGYQNFKVVNWGNSGSRLLIEELKKSPAHLENNLLSFVERRPGDPLISHVKDFEKITRTDIDQLFQEAAEHAGKAIADIDEIILRYIPNVKGQKGKVGGFKAFTVEDYEGDDNYARVHLRRLANGKIEVYHCTHRAKDFAQHIRQSVCVQQGDLIIPSDAWLGLRPFTLQDFQKTQSRLIEDLFKQVGASNAAQLQKITLQFHQAGKELKEVKAVHVGKENRARSYGKIDIHRTDKHGKFIISNPRGMASEAIYGVLSKLKFITTASLPKEFSLSAIVSESIRESKVQVRVPSTPDDFPAEGEIPFRVLSVTLHLVRVEEIVSAENTAQARQRRFYSRELVASVKVGERVYLNFSNRSSDS